MTRVIVSLDEGVEMLKSTKTALFDLDGTLVHFHHEFLYHQTQKVVSELGHPEVCRTTLESHFSDYDFFRFVQAEDPEQFVKRFWEMFDWRGFPAPDVIPGVSEVLKSLKAEGMKLAIVTSRFVKEKDLIEELAPTGLLEHFSFVMPRPSEDIHWTDKRDMFLEACKRFGVTADKVTIVGDTPGDIESGRDIGAANKIAVLSGGITKERLELALPDIILPNVGHLKVISK